MQELSLHVLDVAQNSVRAGATKIDILINEDATKDSLTIVISDNGCGMSEEQVRKVIDPFFTTRTTRKVGLGIPFYKMAAEQTGGSMQIHSTLGVGTTVTAIFGYSHIDRMPLGDIADTVTQLICLNEDIEITYTHIINNEAFTVSTIEIATVLEGLPLATPQVMMFIKEYIQSHILALSADKEVLETNFMEEV